MVLVLLLTKENIWKHSFSFYNDMMLTKCFYRGELNDLEYVKPETYVIERNNRFYYAFIPETGVEQLNSGD
jgi:hypothetical protein